MLDGIKSFLQVLKRTNIRIPQHIPTAWLLVCIGVLSVSIHYVLAEQPLYFWDFRRSWDLYNLLGKQSPIELITNLFYSIYTYDYNYASIVPLLPFYYLFGGGRIAFISASFIVYLVPTILLLAHCLKITLQRTGFLAQPDHELFNFTILFTGSCCYLLWSPTLRGYTDIAGLLPLLGAYLWYQKHDLNASLSLKSCVQLGVLLWLPFMFRRWYLCAVVAFYLSCFMVESLKVYRQPSFNRLIIWKNLWRNLFIAGCTTLLLIGILQGQMLVKIFSNNYFDLYASYQYGWKNNLVLFILRCGIFMLLFAFYGILSGLYLKNKLGYSVLFITVNLLIYVFLFSSIQTYGIHHFMVVGMWMFMLATLGCYWIFNIFSNRLFRLIFLILVNMSWAVAFYAVLLDNAPNNFLAFRLLLYPYRPISFEADDNQIYDIVKDLEQFYQENPKVTFTALGNNGIMSSEGIFVASRNINPDMSQQVIANPQLDQRDGFWLYLLNADYIVVPDPPVMGLNLESDQRIISIPGNMMLKNQGFAKAYQKLDKVYTILEADNHVHDIYIFKRLRPVTQEEVEELYKKFQQYYPDWHYDYRIIEHNFIPTNRDFSWENPKIFFNKYR